MKRFLALLALFALPLLCFAQGRGAWEAGTDGLAPIPPLSARVTDLTNTLSASDKTALEDKLAAWEQKTGNQLVVLLVPSTKEEIVTDTKKSSWGKIKLLYR